MKFLKKLLYIICAFCIIISVFVVLCAINPDLSTKISDFLYARESGMTVPTEAAIEPAQTSEGADLEKEGSGIVSTLQEGNGYVAPKESEIKEPKEVAGKNGYQPIKDQTEVIEDTDGQQILEELGVGETGEGLDFPVDIYPYYGMLNPDLQKLYRQIYANSIALNAHFAPIIEVSVSQLKNVFTAVVCDHPELFWVDTAYQSRYLQSGKCIDIQLQFNQTADNLTQSKEIFEGKANEIINQASGLGSAYEKEVYVHDALIGQVEYDLKAPMNQSAYSALVNGRTVCAGYARAYQYMMQKLGIPCYYCMGFAGENHAWNIVSLEDGYYNVDPTWNDTDPNTYDYFNKSDNDFSLNHVRKDLSVYLPPCNGEQYRELLNSSVETTSVGNGRSLSQTGFAEEDVLYSVEAYYEDCYKQMMETGLGSYSFQNVIKGNDIFQKLYDDYLNDAYRAGYADRVIAELGGTNIQLDLQIEELQDGYLFLNHNVIVN